MVSLSWCLSVISQRVRLNRTACLALPFCQAGLLINQQSDGAARRVWKQHTPRRTVLLQEPSWLIDSAGDQPVSVWPWLFGYSAHWCVLVKWFYTLDLLNYTALHFLFLCVHASEYETLTSIMKRLSWLPPLSEMSSYLRPRLFSFSSITGFFPLAVSMGPWVRT